MTWNKKRDLGIVRIPASLYQEIKRQLHKILLVEDKVYQYYSDEILLISRHPEFDLLKSGEIIPEYKMVVSYLDNIHFQGRFIHFERLKDYESGVCRAGR